MSKKLMFSDNVTYEDAAIARGELLAEEELIGLLERGDDGSEFHAKYTNILRAALRKIDALKAAGEYEDYCAPIHEAMKLDYAKAMKEFEARNPGLLVNREKNLKALDGSIDRLIGNLFAGLKSPDEDQRKRFSTFYEKSGIAAKTLPEVIDTLAVLEKAKTRKRKPKLSVPWLNEALAMDKMREIIAKAEGITIAEAARLADDYDPRPHAPNRAKRLELLFAKKMRLRN